MRTEYQPCFCEMTIKKAETWVVGWGRIYEKGDYLYIYMKIQQHDLLKQKLLVSQEQDISKKAVIL